MKTILLAALGACLLCTCGPAQDKPGARSERGDVLAAERVFTGAYESLDAAVLERMLTDDFTVTYSGQGTEKTKDQWLNELGQLRAVFPRLQIHSDSIEVSPAAAVTVVRGIRIFSWAADGEQGEYRERFVHRWRDESEGLRLAGMELE